MLCGMNPLAQELNSILDRTVAGRLLSRIGREMYFPKGIVAQTAEANAKASRFNATVGMAFAGGQPIMLPAIGRLVGELKPAEVVAYAPTPGVPELRDAWKSAMLRKNPGLAGAEISRPLVTAGLTNGLFQLAELFADPGDLVVVPDLYWGNYSLMFATRKSARIATFPLFDGHGAFNVGGLAAALEGSRKALVILNFPNNPTGYSPTVSEARAIVDTLKKNADAGGDILAICDDAYFGLFYEDDLLKESLFSELVRAHERILAAKVDGSTKEDFAWGFRIGFLTYGGAGMDTESLAALETKSGGSVRATISNSSRIGQSLLLALHQSQELDEQKSEKRAILQERYRRVSSIVKQAPPALRPLPFNSGYFMAFECISVDAEALRKALLDRGIGTIAIGDTYLRVAYSAVDLDDLDELYSEIFETATTLSAE
jgi:aspartate/methionine/tyrosine aminotransferase